MSITALSFSPHNHVASLPCLLVGVGAPPGLCPWDSHMIARRFRAFTFVDVVTCPQQLSAPAAPHRNTRFTGHFRGDQHLHSQPRPFFVQVMFGGHSAGAMAVLIHIDQLRQALPPHTRAVGLVDAGVVPLSQVLRTPASVAPRPSIPEFG